MARKSRKNKAMCGISPEAEKLKYNTGIYVRLSVMDSGKEEGTGILNQRSFLERYVAECHDLVLKAVFVDNGATGTDFARPAWKALMGECVAGRIKCIVVKDLSRLGRNYIETGEYLEKILPLMGIRLIAVNDHYDNAIPAAGASLVINIKNLLNDIYAKDISRKVSAALHTKQKQGAFIGAFAAYGYLKSSENRNQIVIDPETAPVVRRIFKWKAGGMSNAAICRKLTQDGVYAPNAYRLQKGILHDNRHEKSVWAGATIKTIIANPVYIGHMAQKKQSASLLEGKGRIRHPKTEWIVVKNTHQPIISQKMFDRANVAMSLRAEGCRQKQGVNSNIEMPEKVLRGLVFCADCKSPLARYKKVREKGRYIYWTYQCRRHNSLHICPLKYIHEKDLKSAVYEAVCLQIRLWADVGGIMEKSDREAGKLAEYAQDEAEIRDAKKELRRLSALRQTIYDDYAAKRLAVLEYRIAMQKCEEEAGKQHKRLQALQERLTAKEEKTEAKEKKAKAEEEKLTVTMAQAFIARIEISEKNKVSILFSFRDEIEVMAGRARGVA